jgi:hypothetical protein
MQATNTITIEGKQIGRSRALFPAWQMPSPTENGLTLRDLITRVVGEEIAAFRERQERRQTVAALTEREIARGVARGKVDAGGREGVVQEVDEQAAVEAALLAFEDGLFYVFVDDAQQESLDDPVCLRPDSRVTFLRLVALAGG